METNLFKIDIMNIDYKVGEVKLSYKPKFKNQQKVTCSEDAYRYMLSTYKKGTICYKEYFKVLFLNQDNQILGYTLISEGGITETCADVRLIMQAALLTNSVALILAHNHPSGNLKPSPEDIRLTKQVSIIRKTKCSGVSEQNVPFLKTKRTSVNLFSFPPL